MIAPGAYFRDERIWRGRSVWSIGQCVGSPFTLEFMTSLDPS
jgi:hypothetical protein